MIENARPDITIYEPKGLILGNRLFHPLRTDEETQQRLLEEMIDRRTAPVVFTLSAARQRLGRLHPGRAASPLRALLARSLPRGRPPDKRTQGHLDLLAKDFYGALGIAEGLMAHKESYSTGVVAGFLEKARDAMPSDVPKEHRSRFFYIRGVLRENVRDTPGAAADLEIAVSVWPSPDNPAFLALQQHYRRTGNDTAADAVEQRMKQFKRRKGG